VVPCWAASGNDTVDMRMELQVLIPAVEHAEEADLGSEMPWIAVIAAPVDDGQTAQAIARSDRMSVVDHHDNAFEDTRQKGQ
jgi:hypothetical protein